MTNDFKDTLRGVTDPVLIQEAVNARKKQLEELGFVDLVYSNNDYHILISEDDLMMCDTEWKQFVSDFNTYTLGKIPPDVNEIEVVVDEVQQDTVTYTPEPETLIGMTGLDVKQMLAVGLIERFCNFCIETKGDIKPEYAREFVTTEHYEPSTTTP